MRILIIWGESLAKPGGGTVHCFGLAHGLVRLGHQVRIVTPQYAGTTIDPQGLDLQTVRLPRRNLWSFGLLQLRLITRLGRWIRQFRPDAIYVRTCFLQGLAALRSRAGGIPLVGEVDSTVDQEMLMRGQSRMLAAGIRILDRVNNRFSSGLVCVTAGLRDEMLRRGGRPETTVAIHNGANVQTMLPTDRRQARQELGLPADGVIAGFAGSLSPWQGLDLLVDAAKRLVGRRDVPRQLTIAVMGGGMMEQPLRQWIAEAGLQSMFTLMPLGDQTQVCRFLNACDAAVIPIHDERKLRYGLSVLKFWDAMAIGLPAIVPADCGLDDVLTDLGVPGTFRRGDAQALADSLADLASNVQIYRARQNDVRHRVEEKYSWTAVARQLAEFLEELIRRRERKDRRERD